MSLKLSTKQKQELSKLLSEVSQLCELDALGLVTKEGVSLAFFVSADADADLLSAISAAVNSTGEYVTTNLNQGLLTDVVVRGEKGYTILANAGSNIIIGASKEVHTIGLTLRTIREAVVALMIIFEQ